VIGARILSANASGDDLPVVISEVGEASDARHVACCVHARSRFQSCRVDLQPAALGARQAGALPRLEVRAPAGGDEKPLSGDDGAGLHLQDDAHITLLDSNAGVAGDELDAVGFEVRLQAGPRLGLLQPKESRSGLDDLHLRAESRERLAELQPDRAAAENSERDRQLAGERRLSIRPVIDGIEAWNRRYRRSAAVGDHHRLTGDVAFAADLDGFVI